MSLIDISLLSTSLGGWTTEYISMSPWRGWYGVSPLCPADGGRYLACLSSNVIVVHTDTSLPHGLVLAEAQSCSRETNTTRQARSKLAASSITPPPVCSIEMTHSYRIFPSPPFFKCQERARYGIEGGGMVVNLTQWAHEISPIKWPPCKSPVRALQYRRGSLK